MTGDPECAKGHRHPIGWLGIVGTVAAVILLPFVLFGDDLDRWSVARLDLAASHRSVVFIGVVTLLAADVFLPIPSSIVSTVSGAVLGLRLGTLASLIGLTAGAVVGYAVGVTAGHRMARRVVGQVDLQRFERLVERHGIWSVVVARSIPVLSEASTVFAGLGRMPFRRFLASSGLANLGVSIAYAAAGHIAAETGFFAVAFGAAVGVPGIAWLGLSRRAPKARMAPE